MDGKERNTHTCTKREDGVVLQEVVVVAHTKKHQEEPAGMNSWSGRLFHLTALPKSVGWIGSSDE